MSVFEIIMLLCFGAAWPVSIYKSYKSGTTEGKSVLFLFIVLLGYLSGITHKLINNPDFVTWFYVINALLVAADMALYYRNRALESGRTLEKSVRKLL